MITLKDLSHTITVKGRDRWLLKGQSTSFGSKERVGILLDKGNGKSVLSRLLCGIDRPDRGAIERIGTVSWPVGLAGIIHQDLSVSQNLEIVLRLSTTEQGKALDRFRFVIGQDLDLRAKAKTLTPSERALFGYALSIMVPHQHYIFDEKVTVGTAAQRRRQEDLLGSEFGHSGLVLMSSNRSLIQRYCERGFCVSQAKLLRMPEIGTTTPTVSHV